jgi:hypothetical protein
VSPLLCAALRLRHRPRVRRVLPGEVGTAVAPVGDPPAHVGREAGCLTGQLRAPGLLVLRRGPPGDAAEQPVAAVFGHDGELNEVAAGGLGGGDRQVVHGRNEAVVDRRRRDIERVSLRQVAEGRVRYQRVQVAVGRRDGRALLLRRRGLGRGRPGGGAGRTGGGAGRTGGGADRGGVAGRGGSQDLGGHERQGDCGRHGDRKRGTARPQAAQVYSASLEPLTREPPSLDSYLPDSGGPPIGCPAPGKITANGTRKPPSFGMNRLGTGRGGIAASDLGRSGRFFIRSSGRRGGARQAGRGGGRQAVEVDALR